MGNKDVQSAIEKNLPIAQVHRASFNIVTHGRKILDEFAENWSSLYNKKIKEIKFPYGVRYMRDSHNSNWTETHVNHQECISGLIPFVVVTEDFSSLEGYVNYCIDNELDESGMLTFLVEYYISLSNVDVKGMTAIERLAWRFNED